MEYLVVGLLVTLVIVLYFNKPKQLYTVVLVSAIEALKKNESELVLRLWNRLPDKIKDDVGSEQVAKIVGYLLGIFIELLEETIDNNPDITK